MCEGIFSLFLSDDTSFEIWETFPDNRGAQDDDSGEEQDDYFSDSD
jgi:hypothetical protein